MNAIRWFLEPLVGVCLIALAWCSPAPPTLGVTYTIAFVTKSADGKVKQQGEALRMESAEVDTIQTINDEGTFLSVYVLKTQYGKATFEITFPDKSTQKVQVKAGEPKTLLPRGQKVGVRIAVEEAH
jgi:hypothetical protein